ncbi:aminodeoxychorismate synthase component I [Martelella alba]|uniref:aminodeoxychorismate synthase n=1 Tax=Martelella alba TaxID=2590451 RepID=A0ABY2SJ01_9HYPH|nr:aminodeoxychorismate synthase component I [Martelella alba]TKI04611.1 aminodeoxychorismate synthase component I [Martelella alba]
MKVLIIDNFDSFTNNIAQCIYEICGCRPEIIPNNTPIAHVNITRYDAIILSPGPGTPANDDDFGICRLILAQRATPILGICLGHQGINHFYGGRVLRAPQPVHGYRSNVKHTGQGIFAGIPDNFAVVRYHSLICGEVPDCLEITAWTDDGLVMALAHRELPVYGVQFHPESIDSEYGHQILANFLDIASAKQARTSLYPEMQSVMAKVGGPTCMRVTAVPSGNGQGPEETFAERFSTCSHSFWLDSELSSGTHARYSVMGNGGPDGALIFSYQVATRRLTVTGPNGTAQLTGDLFELLDRIFSAISLEIAQPLPFPFQGGAVGYLGYELRTLKGGATRHQSHYPDALLYLPQNYIVFDHQEQTSWLCNAWGKPLEPASADGRSRRPAAGAEFIPGAVPAQALDLDDSHDEYIDKIENCLQEIINGEAYEICLTNRARLGFSQEPMAAYLKMRRISPVPYGAFFNNGTFAILSSSPETFLKIDREGRVSSKPIKGTRPRGTNREQDAALKQELASSAKDRAENLMIVDLVRHDLNSICVAGSVKVPSAFAIESYSSVHQLVSTVEGRLLAGTSLFHAIQACFPGGSMTGAPKIRAMEIIDRLEDSARGIYAGAIGWIGLDGYADLSIVIRTAVIKEGVAEFGIGGAIVAHSDPENEMLETLVKASVPFTALTDTPS